jgi:hypothetical protein
MPTATVEIHTITPETGDEPGRRIPASTIHPAAKPDKKGQAVELSPARLTPWS